MKEDRPAMPWRPGAIRHCGADGVWLVTEPHDALYSTATMAAQEWWDSQQERWRPIFEHDMTEPKTAAQRKAAERQRHRKAGRTAVTVHVRPEWAAEVRELEAKLQRRERRRPAAGVSK